MHQFCISVGKEDTQRADAWHPEHRALDPSLDTRVRRRREAIKAPRADTNVDFGTHGENYAYG